MVLDQVEKILLYILVTYQVAIGSGHLVGVETSMYKLAAAKCSIILYGYFVFSASDDVIFFKKY